MQDLPEGSGGRQRAIALERAPEKDREAGKSLSASQPGWSGTGAGSLHTHHLHVMAKAAARVECELTLSYFDSAQDTWPAYPGPCVACTHKFTHATHMHARTCVHLSLYHTHIPSCICACPYVLAHSLF